MRYMLYHVSQVAVITPRDAGRRICETQLRRSVCCRVAKTGGMDSQVPFKSHPGHTRLLIGVGHTSHTFIFGYRNLNRLSPCLQGPFVPCHWWQCELHRWDHSRSWSELLRKVCFSLVCLHQSHVLLGLFVSLGGHANIDFSLPCAVLLLRRWYILALKGHLTRSAEIGRKHAVRIGRMWTISVTQRQVFGICVFGILGLLSLPIQGIRALRLWRCLRRIRLTLSWRICVCLLSHLFLLLNLLDLKLTCQGTELHVSFLQFGSVRSVQAAAVPLCL